MLSAFVAAASLAAYAIGPGDVLPYSAEMRFEGFVPVFGGYEGTVGVSMGVLVEGVEPTDTDQAATNEITRFEVTLNDMTLPVGVSDAERYFPKSTVGFGPLGVVETNDAPAIDLPVRIPGLDARRFPDLVWLPIQLPDEPLEEGTTWSFTRDFGPAPMRYRCRVRRVEGSRVVVAVNVRQRMTTLEDAALQTVENEADAEARVTSVLTGSGEVVFDLELGAVVRSTIRTKAVSTAVSLSDGSETVRELRSTVEVTLDGHEPAPVTPEVSPSPWNLGQVADLFGGALEWGLRLLPENLRAAVGNLLRWFSENRPER